MWEDKPFNQGAAWVDMLLMANHKDKKIMFDKRPLIVKSGTFITSSRKLSDKWGWSRGKVDRFLKTLQDEEMIIVDVNTKRTAITIVNYRVYQDSQTTDSTTDSTTDEPLTEPQTDTNKNDKNVKNEKNEKNNKVKAVALLEELLVGRNISEPLADKLHEWICYKCERKEGYQETGLKSLLSQMEKKEQQYGAIALIECIETCMSRQYKGIIDDLINKNKQPTENDYLERWKNA